VIVGPGNAWVQEAKRQVNGVVGIDGLAGPSELVVVAGEGADPELAALDLLAQGEHGPDSLLCLIATDDGLAGAVERLLEQRGDADGQVALVEVADARAALRLADALAPEHLELVGDDVEPLAGRVRAAGCVFVGRDGAAAFGDYVAGSNHVLPTGGAARFAGALSPATFRRRMARVSLRPGAAGRLAAAAVPLARAEGFALHGESMERRA
jgi:histidinol dehydrogenase